MRRWSEKRVCRPKDFFIGNVESELKTVLKMGNETISIIFVTLKLESSRENQGMYAKSLM